MMYVALDSDFMDVRGAEWSVSVLDRQCTDDGYCSTSCTGTHYVCELCGDWITREAFRCEGWILCVKCVRVRYSK